jgi:hypothetical protein
MSNGLPESDSERHDFQAHYIAKIAADPGAYGHTKEDVDRLLAAQATWVLAYAAHKKAQIDAVARSRTASTGVNSG